MNGSRLRLATLALGLSIGLSIGCVVDVEQGSGGSDGSGGGAAVRSCYSDPCEAPAASCPLNERAISCDLGEDPADRYDCTAVGVACGRARYCCVP